jgi:hypothetical protein
MVPGTMQHPRPVSVLFEQSALFERCVADLSALCGQLLLEFRQQP